MVLPSADAGVARRLVHLRDGLRPLAGRLPAAQVASPPAILSLEFDDLRGLVAPILAPVLRHQRFTQRTILLNDVHFEHVHQTQESPLILIDVHALSTPRLIRPVALECRDARFVQGAPRRGRGRINADRDTPRGAANNTGRERTAFFMAIDPDITQYGFCGLSLGLSVLSILCVNANDSC